MKRILIDTNAYVKFLHGDTAVLDMLAVADTVYLSVFVLGELLAGFKGGTKEPQNRKTLNAFLRKSAVRILSATMDTAEFFSDIKDGLRRKGTPIPQNDIWIAAHVMESGSMLITYDAHFSLISGLLIWSGKT